MSHTKIRLSIQILISMITFSSAILLSSSIIFEFGLLEYIDFYLPTYPHLIYFPIKFLWAVGICITLAWSYVPLTKRRTKHLMIILLLSSGISALITFAEHFGNNKMVVEFSRETRDNYCMMEIVEAAQSGSEFVCNRKDFPAVGSFHQNNDELFSRKFWIQDDKFISDSSSFSRIFYIYTVWSMVFLIVFTFSMIRFYPPHEKNKGVHTIRTKLQVRFGALHMLAVLSLVMWLPFRGYYNSQIKYNLFHNHGLIPNFPSIGGPEVIIIVFFIIFLIYAWFKVFQIDDRFQNFVLQILPITGFALLLQFPQYAGGIFGFKPFFPVVIVAWLMLFAFLIIFPFLNQQKK